MTCNDRTLARVVMQVPKLIRPPTDATPAEAAAARGKQRALHDDFLREASARLGIMSLVAAGLWIAGTILGRLAMRSIPCDQSIGIGVVAEQHLGALLVSGLAPQAHGVPARLALAGREAIERLAAARMEAP